MSREASVRESLQQSLGGGGSANLGAVDEEDETITPGLGRMATKAVGPALDRLRRIADRLGLDATPQAGVDEIAGGSSKAG